jgi:hypothetical protein
VVNGTALHREWPGPAQMDSLKHVSLSRAAYPLVVDNGSGNRAKGEAEEPEAAESKARPRRKVTFGLGIDVKASVDRFMARNKGVMERLKNL